MTLWTNAQRSSLHIGTSRKQLANLKQPIKTTLLGLKRKDTALGGSWVEELHNVFWALNDLQTHYNGNTIQLIYGSEAVASLEMVVWQCLKQCGTNDKLRYSRWSMIGIKRNTRTHEANYYTLLKSTSQYSSSHGKKDDTKTRLIKKLGSRHKMERVVQYHQDHHTKFILFGKFRRCEINLTSECSAFKAFSCITH